MVESEQLRRLVIVTGARGVVGREYLTFLSKESATKCIGIARGAVPGAEFLTLDLLDSEATAEAIGRVSLSDFDEVVFIHSIGKFKFEPEGIPEIDVNADGIDDEVYANNVDTFLNVLRPLVIKIEKERSLGQNISLALCSMGSVSDKYNVKFWSSYTKAKNVLRSIIYGLVQEKPEYCRGLFVNVSTVDTENENELRPNADKSYWLTGSEIVKASIPYLLREKKGTWKQIDVFKESPLFQEGYYENLEEIRRRWEEQMKKETSAERLGEHTREGNVKVEDSLKDVFEDTGFRFPFR